MRTEADAVANRMARMLAGTHDTTHNLVSYYRGEVVVCAPAAGERVYVCLGSQ
jgi:hypothetical protein